MVFNLNSFFFVSFKELLLYFSTFAPPKKYINTSDCSASWKASPAAVWRQQDWYVDKSVASNCTNRPVSLIRSHVDDSLLKNNHMRTSSNIRLAGYNLILCLFPHLKTAQVFLAADFSTFHWCFFNQSHRTMPSTIDYMWTIFPPSPTPIYRQSCMHFCTDCDPSPLIECSTVYCETMIQKRDHINRFDQTIIYHVSRVIVRL